MSNRNLKTGYPYSVVAGIHLDQYVFNELMYTSGKDLNYEAAYNEAKAAAKSKFQDLREKYEQLAADNGAAADLVSSAADELMEAAEECHNESDEESFVDQEMEQFSDTFSSDSDCIHVEGEHEGVRYMIGSLGGASLVWSINGPLGKVRSLCSPCVPGAADLDSGYILPDEKGYEESDFSHTAHTLPRSWFPTPESTDDQA